MMQKIKKIHRNINIKNRLKKCWFVPCILQANRRKTITIRHHLHQDYSSRTHLGLLLFLQLQVAVNVKITQSLPRNSVKINFNFENNKKYYRNNKIQSSSPPSTSCRPSFTKCNGIS